MPSKPVPLSTLLSQLYVAFTIEFDNEWERRLHKAGWWPRFLVSYVMWANLMRWVGEEPITVAELEERAGVWNGPIHLGRMEQWWGYLTITPDPAASSAKPRRAEHLVNASVSGELALSKWSGLDHWVHDRWVERFGQKRMSQLTGALTKIERANDLDLPDAMPVLDYSDAYVTPRPSGGVASPARSKPKTIGALLARVLLAFTLEYEAKAPLSLPVCACVLRLIGKEPILAKEVPLLSGVRKEATDPVIKSLAKRGFLATSGAGAKMTVHLTHEGSSVKTTHTRRLTEIETSWNERFGAEALGNLRAALEAMYDEPKGHSLISPGLVPPERGWRATKAYKAQTEAFLGSPRNGLPHHPLLTHRGGWPDGA